MNKILSALLLLLIMFRLSPLIAEVDSPLQVELTEAQLIELLGEPQSQILVGKRKVLIFPDGKKLEIEKGIVVVKDELTRIQLNEIAAQRVVKPSPPEPVPPETELEAALDQMMIQVDASSEPSAVLSALSETFEPDASFYRNAFLTGVGLLLNLGAFIWLSINAFRVSTSWGLSVSFIPLSSIYFLKRHWAYGRKPVYLWIFSLLPLFGAMLIR